MCKQALIYFGGNVNWFYPIAILTQICTDMCTGLFTVALFIIIKKLETTSAHKRVHMTMEY